MEESELFLYSFDEICESQDFAHDQMFVTKEQFGAKIAEQAAEISNLRSSYDKAMASRNLQAKTIERLTAALERISELTKDGRQDMRTHSIALKALEQAKGRGE